MKKFTERLRKSNMAKALATLILILMLTCKINDVLNWLEDMGTHDLVKSIKEFVKKLATKAMHAIEKTKVGKMAKKGAEKARTIVTNVIQYFIDKVHDYDMKGVISSEKDSAVVLAPIFLLICTMMAAMAILIVIMAITKSPLHITAVCSTMLVFAFPASMATILFTLFSVIPISKKMFTLYKSLPLGGLEKNANMIYNLQCKLFTMVTYLSVVTMFGYIFAKAVFTGPFGFIYKAFVLITLNAWQIMLWSMCADGMFILAACITAIAAQKLDIRGPKRLAKGKRLRPLLETISLEKTYVPKRLAQGNIFIMRK